ncbi:MAG: hypothetical protein KI792_02890 [Alphaproteobacteria bacterium]|nr:hypothetical protein [Alphaproteobacteria bacterium SS10]
MTFIPRLDRKMQPLAPETGKAVLQQINRHFTARPMAVKSTELSWMSLPFYDDMLLYAATDYSVIPALTKYVLRRGTEVFPIDYTPTPIMAANQSAPLTLTSDNAVEYLRFFTRFVWRMGEPQWLIESPADLPALSTMAASDQRRIQAALHPIRIRSAGDAFPDGFVIDACFVSGTTLVSRRLLVPADGNVRSAPDRVLFDGKPVTMEMQMR